MNIRDFDRDQLLMLPPSVAEWLPARHLARTVVSVVDNLDLSGFYTRLRADGRGGASYDPRLMVGLLLYGYCIGERSARRLERMCWQDVAVRFVMANAQPDHATIARFRADHDIEVEGLFVQVLAVCGRAGLGKVGTVAIDGTKLVADACKQRVVDEEQLRKIARQILDEAARVDAEEDALYGDGNGEELPDDEAILKALEELGAIKGSRDARHEMRAHEREQLKAEGRPVPDWFVKNNNPRKAVKVNLTDPDSRQVRSQGVSFCGYNAQAVTSEDQLIVAASVEQQPDDMDLLNPMIAHARENIERAGIDASIECVLVDGGYASEHVIATMAPDSPEVVLPNTDKLKRSRFEPARQLAAWCDTEPRRQLRAQRKAIIEGVFGQIKHNRGIRRASRRGWHAMQAEWHLICTTHNLLKLHNALEPA